MHENKKKEFSQTRITDVPNDSEEGTRVFFSFEKKTDEKYSKCLRKARGERTNVDRMPSNNNSPYNVHLAGVVEGFRFCRIYLGGEYTIKSLRKHTMEVA